MTGISIESGVKIKSDSELRKLKPVLDNWVEIVQEYSRAFQNHDACWWYTERANVGILAAAAWRTKGWLALEEYSTSKRRDGTGSKNGRCDLYMAKNNHDNSFAFEAKQAWQTMRSDDISKILGQLAKARKDAGNLERVEAETRVAACFVIPKMPSRHADDHFDNQILKWLDYVIKNVCWDAVAWVFPKKGRQIKNGAETRIYPGVLLVLQEKCRANKRPKISAP